MTATRVLLRLAALLLLALSTPPTSAMPAETSSSTSSVSASFSSSSVQASTSSSSSSPSASEPRSTKKLDQEPSTINTTHNATADGAPVDHQELNEDQSAKAEPEPSAEPEPTAAEAQPEPQPEPQTPVKDTEAIVEVSNDLLAVSAAKTKGADVHGSASVASLSTALLAIAAAITLRIL